MSWDKNDFEDTMQRSGISKMASEVRGKPKNVLNWKLREERRG